MASSSSILVAHFVNTTSANADSCAGAVAFVDDTLQSLRFENIAALWALTFLLICAGSLADIPAPRRCRPLLSLSFWVWVLLSVLQSAVAAASAAVHGMSLCAFLRDSVANRCLMPWKHGVSLFSVYALLAVGFQPRVVLALFQVLAGLVSLIMAARTWRTVRNRRDVARWWVERFCPAALAVASAPTLLAAVASLVSLSAVLGVAFAPVSLAILCIQWVLLKAARWSVERAGEGSVVHRACVWTMTFWDGADGGAGDAHGTSTRGEGYFFALYHLPASFGAAAALAVPLVAPGTLLALFVYGGRSVAQNNGLIVDIYAATFAAFTSGGSFALPLLELDESKVRAEMRSVATGAISYPPSVSSADWSAGTLSRHATALLTLSIAVAVARLMLFGLLRAIVRAPCTVPVTVPPSMVAGDGSWARCGGVHELRRRLGLITRSYSYRHSSSSDDGGTGGRSVSGGGGGEFEAVVIPAGQPGTTVDSFIPEGGSQMSQTFGGTTAGWTQQAGMDSTANSVTSRRLRAAASAASKSGVMEKKGQWRRNWNVRDFELDGCELRYFEPSAAGTSTDSRSTPRGRVVVLGVSSVPDRPGKRPHRLNIACHGGRVLAVAAQSALAKEEWASALAAAAQLATTSRSLDPNPGALRPFGALAPAPIYRNDGDVSV